MIKLNVVCRVVLHIIGGRVDADVLVDPDCILESIFTNIALDYRSQYRLSTRKLISKERDRRMVENIPVDIKYSTAEVENKFMHIDMSDAMRDLDRYLTGRNHDENCNKRDKELWDDFFKLRDYIYRCEDCRFTSDTANVMFEEVNK